MVYHFKLHFNKRSITQISITMIHDVVSIICYLFTKRAEFQDIL